MFIYVGDTHGYLSQTERLVSRLERDGYLSDHKLVFLGDYLDRGPEVRGLLQLCIGLKAQGHIFLMGNHEYVLLKTLHTSTRQEDWAKFWSRSFGEETLRSFGIRVSTYNNCVETVNLFRSSMSPAEVNFLENLVYYHETTKYLAIHSGVLEEPSWRQQKLNLGEWDFRTDPCPRQIDERQLDWFPADLDKTVVSGHCIVGPNPVFGQQFAMLDTGIYRYQRLTAWIPDRSEIAVADEREVTIKRLDG